MVTGQNRAQRIETEKIRTAAFEDLRSGMRQSKVAAKYGASQTSASRWMKMLKAGRSPDRRPTTGRPRRLTAEQLSTLQSMDLKSVPIYGLQRYISEQFGVSYHRDHLYRLRKKLLAKPVTDS